MIIKNPTNSAKNSDPHLGFDLVENGMTDITSIKIDTKSVAPILNIKSKLTFDPTVPKLVELSGIVRTSIIIDCASKNNPTGIKKRNPQNMKNQAGGEAVLVCINILIIRTMITINPPNAPK